MEVTLPFPPAKLSPNARLHWAVRSSLVKGYRTACWAITNTVQKRAVSTPDWPRPLPVQITFCPPDKRLRDRDNMIAAFKAGADGVADAIGVDDALWLPTYHQGEPVKGGAVIIKIGAS